MVIFSDPFEVNRPANDIRWFRNRKRWEPHMICVEGYKAFRGKMRVWSRTGDFAAYEIHGDWLYKPDTNCWYCKGSSYPDKLCEILDID